MRLCAVLPLCVVARPVAKFVGVFQESGHNIFLRQGVGDSGQDTCAYDVLSSLRSASRAHVHVAPVSTSALAFEHSFTRAAMAANNETTLYTNLLKPLQVHCLLCAVPCKL